MYGENTKYHSNPYIQGTTVPCDTHVNREMGYVSSYYIMYVCFTYYIQGRRNRYGHYGHGRTTFSAVHLYNRAVDIAIILLSPNIAL